MQLEELSNISDNLAMMPDPALQQFAQMHKTDPYISPLDLDQLATLLDITLEADPISHLQVLSIDHNSHLSLLVHQYSTQA
jgi:hypothetical protein